MAVNWGLINPAVQPYSGPSPLEGIVQGMDQGQESRLRGLQIQGQTQALKDKANADKAQQLYVQSLQAKDPGQQTVLRQAAMATHAPTVMALDKAQQENDASKAQMQKNQFDVLKDAAPALADAKTQLDGMTPEQRTAYIQNDPVLSKILPPATNPDGSHAPLTDDKYQPLMQSMQAIVKKNYEVKTAQDPTTGKPVLAYFNKDKPDAPPVYTKAVDPAATTAAAQLGVAQGNLAVNQAKEATAATAITKPFEATDSNGKPVLLQQNKTGVITPVQGYGPKAASTGLTGRESVMMERVTGSSREVMTDLQNLAALPVGASSGVFGVGASPGTGLLASAKGALTNTLAPDDVRSFEAVAPGLARNLQIVTNRGLQGAQSGMASFEKYQWREGDTQLDKMQKMAAMRQVVDRQLEVSLANPRLSDEQRAQIQTTKDDVGSAVPFTVKDVIALKNAKNPQTTMADVIKQRTGKASVSPPPMAMPGVPGAATPTVPTTAQPAAAAGGLPDGATATGPGGQKIIRHGGQWVPING